MTIFATTALALPGLLALGLAIYLMGLALASFFWSDRHLGETQGATRVVVLVPAHDEELLIRRCLDSLFAQSYPRHLYRVVVIADNCSDATAKVAADAGATVMRRGNAAEKGKGHALRWALDQILPADAGIDAVVVVDADSLAEPNLLSELVASLELGHDVVQAEYLVLPGDNTLRTRLAELAFLLFHRVRFCGRAVLGMPASLVGNGMLFSRRVLVDHPWNAFSAVEDLEYTLNLREAGIRPHFARNARVRGPLARSYRTGARQRVRWEGGRMQLARTRLPRLIWSAASRRNPGLLDAAVDLAAPPVAAFALILGLGLGLSTAAVLVGLAGAWVAMIWLGATGALAAFVLIGIRAAGAPLTSYLILLEAPRFFAWKLVAYTRIVFGFDPNRWEISDRGDAGPESARLEIAGVRVDPLSMESACARILRAIGAPSLLQVTTVNLDFLVRAQTNAELRQVFHRSGLNLPDGAPVVWLGRLLGIRMPGRVAGADLIPRLATEAALVGARIFLLGGEDGAARDAAASLQHDNPALQIAGWLEPPRSSLEDMDHEAILTGIREARADILLVALGHPKQDLWIDRNRERLSVSVAIGVGCVFDILAKRQRRAPSWMRSAGLEWLHRLRKEPRRLVRRYGTDLGWLPVLTARVLYRRILAGPARTT